MVCLVMLGNASFLPLTIAWLIISGVVCFALWVGWHLLVDEDDPRVLEAEQKLRQDSGADEIFYRHGSRDSRNRFG